MAVKLVIKTPPDPAKLGTTHSVYKGTQFYLAPTSVHNWSPAQSPTAPTAISFVRNNRVIGYFADAVQAKSALDYLIQRENELGVDI